MPTLPKWPKRAVGAIAALFRPLQDIDVYVEDEGSEAFYTALLSRIAPEGLRLKRIFPLCGRRNVLERAASHDFAVRRALFLVDGDFAWVRGEPAPTEKGTYRLDAYCVENLLVCEYGATQLLMECEASVESDARSALDFATWLRTVDCLLGLFVVWAALNKISPTVATTSTRIGQFVTSTSAGAVVDSAKVEKARVDALNAVYAHPDGDAVLKEISARVASLQFPMDAVSGKDFLLPALEFHIRSRTSEKCTRKVLSFRLARHAAPERFVGLTEALLRAAKGTL